VVNFTDGQTQQTVLVTVNDDTIEEIDQIVTVNLEAIGDENVTTSFVTFTVFDNDGDNAPPSDSGGGSTGLLGLLAASLTLFRRRKVVK
jgi:hypothetical protein